MLGAMAAVQPSFKASVESCLTQIVGVLFGALVGVLLLALRLPSLVATGIGLILVITLYNSLGIRFSNGIPSFIVVMICTTPDIQPMTYAIVRIWDTAIGLSVGMLINVLVLPYDNSLKIKSTIEYLEKEVIDFLEEMFSDKKSCPDIREMTTTINEIGSQLGIYSNQWLPLKTKNNHKKLEVFRVCEGKARQLLAQMEVLVRMESRGRLHEENLQHLKACGLHLLNTRGIDSMQEIDVITNYHVEQILILRQELMEYLGQLSQKKR
jgi:uncharacterized membrane protein YgaE (UPF0421/DUF939 family)